MRWGGVGCFSVGLVIACGSRTGLLYDDGKTWPVTEDGGTVCYGTPNPATPPIPNLYFVLDASTSMTDQNKWSDVRTVIGAVIQQVGSRARFGAAVFPTSPTRTDSCNSGVEVMPLKLGDDHGATLAAFMKATNISPNGGTPTASTLELLTPTLRAFPGVTYVIVATDGGPNCNLDITCGVDQCTNNLESLGTGCTPGGSVNCCDASNPVVAGPQGCLDGARATLAVSDLRASGIRTFVIGIPGSSLYASVLDDMAVAGGTARSSEPLYYSVNSSDTTELETTIEAVTLQTLSCALTLARAPSTTIGLNAYIGGVWVPRSTAAGADGWTLEGTTLAFTGAPCSELEANPSSEVTLVEGCPPVGGGE
jgi:hypothetical protein